MSAWYSWQCKIVSTELCLMHQAVEDFTCISQSQNGCRWTEEVPLPRDGSLSGNSSSPVLTVTAQKRSFELFVAKTSSYLFFRSRAYHKKEEMHLFTCTHTPWAAVPSFRMLSKRWRHINRNDLEDDTLPLLKESGIMSSSAPCPWRHNWEGQEESALFSVIHYEQHPRHCCQLPLLTVTHTFRVTVVPMAISRAAGRKPGAHVVSSTCQRTAIKIVGSWKASTQPELLKSWGDYALEKRISDTWWTSWSSFSLKIFYIVW